ncbi:MAG: ABC transporter permease [Immundisolibacterales bacterium]|nr:ABC transporter permease [Immundisolibacterales bacterium]
MNSFVLGMRTIGRRPLPAVLTLVLLMLGIATVVVVLLFERELEDRLGRDARGVDLVVGAKGSGLQLVLSAVFHIDVPTGNVRLPELREIARHPMVAGVIPLSLGDAYRGFRIVGTTHAYPDHYGARLAGGRLWERSMEAVAGARAARETGLREGSSFVGAHGLEGDSGFHHDEQPYRVVGVLRETGTVLDRLILVNSASVWEVHSVHDDPTPADAAGGADEADPSSTEASGAEKGAAGGNFGLPPGDREVTAMLVRYRTPLAAISLPRAINSGTGLQAASPAQETARLFYLVGTGLDAFRAFAGVLVVASALSLFIALWHALHEQRYDLAVMRTLGASRGRILRFVLVQGAVLGAAGAALGTALGHASGWVLAQWLERERNLSMGSLGWAPEEGVVIAGAVLIALVAAAVPAMRAYRLDVAAVLAERR